MTTMEMRNLIDTTPKTDDAGDLTAHGKLYTEFRNHLSWYCTFEVEIDPFITRLLRDMIEYHGRPNDYRKEVWKHFDAITPMQLDDAIVLEIVVKLAGHATVEGWYNEKMRRLYFINTQAHDDILKKLEGVEVTPSNIIEAVKYARLQQNKLIGTNYKNYRI